MTNNKSNKQTNYKYGFTSDIDQNVMAPGISEQTIRLISAKKNEPSWLLEFRLKAYFHWLKEKKNPPTWADLDIKPIDFNQISFYAEIKKSNSNKSLENIKKVWIEELVNLYPTHKTPH